MDVRRAVSWTVGAVVMAASTVVGAPAAQAAGGVCEGVDGCVVVTTVDVDGDGKGDQVGVVREGEPGAEEGSVTVRVRTAAGKVVSARRTTASWYGAKVWRGAATLDSRPGRELVVGYSSGAHTLFLRALTWRKGRLVDLKAPGGGTWVIDGAYSIALGWTRAASDPAGLVRKRYAARGQDGRMRGTISTWRHGDKGWSRKSVKRLGVISDERAYSWGGWAIRGLPRW